MLVMKAPPPSVGVLNLMIYCLLPVTVFSVTLLTAVWMYRHRKPPYGHVDIIEVSDVVPLGPLVGTAAVCLNTIQA